MITHELLDRFRAGRCTPEEITALQAYFNQPDLSALAELLAADWQQTDPNAPLPEGVSMRLWQRVSQSIQEETVPVYSLNSRWIVRWQWGIAASVGIGLLVGGLFWARQTKRGLTPIANVEQAASGWLTQHNSTTQPQTLALTDGSTVLIQPRSQVSYPAAFKGARRTVRLTGEAFFSVQPDKAHPFVVQTSSVLVRVVGTSFTVRAFTGQTTAEVSVRTGRVSVSPADGKTALVLTPNQRATLTVANGQLVKSLVVAPDVINPRAVVNQFAFADTPVTDVFAVLEKAYGVTIQFDRQKLANCTLTATLTDQPLFTKLEMICASVGTTYSVLGTTIVISGTGCD